MAKDLKNKLVDMVVMTVARDMLRTSMEKVKKVYRESRDKTNVRSRKREEKDDELEP